MNKMAIFWERNFGQGSRKFSLAVSAAWLYTILILGFWFKPYHYLGFVLGIVLLMLDNNYLNQLKNRKKHENDIYGRKGK